ncbi:hypothetical protein [Phenylobacterium sp.]|uniref:hypothetical protein n=1 Tax=Phenylobacterium sp. TaxID=1871053 RepID=UPI002DEAB0F3|nr:hypothetical protein [Phenylobacterium sp.]
MRALFLALAAVLAFGVTAPQAQAQGAQSAPASWKTFRYPDLHVIFRAPAEAQPQVQRNTAQVSGVTVSDDHIVVIGKPDVAYMIGVSDWTGNSNAMNIDGVAPAAVKGMSGQIVGPVRTLSWSGGEAREYDASTTNLTIRSRVILVNRRLVQVMVLCTGGVLPPDAQAFLESVTVMP